MRRKTLGCAYFAVLALAPHLLAGSFDTHMAKARDAESRGNLTLAAQEYQAALKSVRENPRNMRGVLALEALSKVAERQHDLPAAEQYLLDALDMRRNAGVGAMGELPVLLDLQQFYAAHKRWKDGAAIADRMASIWRDAGAGNQPGTAQYLSLAGLMYHSDGDYIQAEKRYDSALTILAATTGTDSAAWGHVAGELAKTLTMEGRVVEAAAEFKRSLAASPAAFRFTYGREYLEFLRAHNLEADAGEFEKNRAADAAIRLSKGITPPQISNQHEPEFSEEARARKITGNIVLYMEVDRSGRVQDIAVLEPLGFGLDENAIRTVQSWTFRPATKDGEPVRVAASVEVHFRLF